MEKVNEYYPWLMIYISDIQQLADKWTERMNNPAQSFDYKNALSECIYDLNQLINKTLLDQMTEEDARDYILSQEADSYISCEENYYATAI
jgi:hypothetical protein